MQLADVLAALNGLPASEREAVTRDALAATNDMRFVPLPGAQTEAYTSKADVLLYGGSAGCGKSFLTVGLASQAHTRSIIFRRESSQTDGLQEAGRQIIGDSARFNGTDLEWTWPDGRSVKLAGMQLIGDWNKHAGRERDLMCVAGDTPVKMADGGFVRADSVTVGMMVATLEGPRRVAKCHPVQHKPLVRLTIGDVSQVQSSTHPMLTSDGWLSAGDLIEARAPISRRNAVSIPRLTGQKFSVLAARSLSALTGLARKAAEGLALLGRAGLLALREVAVLPSLGSGCAAYCDCIQLARPLGASFRRQAKAQRSRVELAPFAFLHGLSRDAACAHGETSPQGLTDGCSSCIHPCGGHARKYQSRLSGSSGAPVSLLLLSDAGQQSRDCSRADDSASTQKHSQASVEYAHPYTKEVRRVVAGHLQECVSFDLQDAGFGDVYDFEIEGANHYITACGIVNRNCFDEAGEFHREQVSSLMAWNRGPEGQRTRIVLASNPPRTTDGAWMVEWFAPWLDKKHPDPADPGDLRWAVMVKGSPVWMDGPGVHLIDGEQYTAMSFTFIPASLKDNPFRDTPEYRARLQSLPEPLRSQLLYGLFDATSEDDQWQCIPSQWVYAAVQRWTSVPPIGVPMCCIGVDVAQGGADNTVLAPRHDGWFAPLLAVPGEKTPGGTDVAGLITAKRRDNAMIVIDIGGGWGGEAYGHLRANQIEAVPYMGVKSSTRRTADGQLTFGNVRTEAYWRFREALNPDQPGGSPIMLPDDRILISDLCAPRYEVRSNGLHVEPKDKLIKRIGRSPDRGDAVVMSWHSGAKAASNWGQWPASQGRRRMPNVNLGHSAARRKS